LLDFVVFIIFLIKKKLKEKWGKWGASFVVLVLSSSFFDFLLYNNNNNNNKKMRSNSRKKQLTPIYIFYFKSTKLRQFDLFLEIKAYFGFHEKNKKGNKFNKIIHNKLNMKSNLYIFSKNNNDFTNNKN
jgi:hypothetical protein